MMYVKPKKFLGQHFLKDDNIAKKIAEIPVYNNDTLYLEIGPGTGVLTRFILEQKPRHYCAIEVDTESVAYLQKHYPNLSVLHKDFLKLDLHQILLEYKCKNIYIIGNFPYNISSQILVKAFENRDIISGLTGMLQKEVCDRIKSPHGSKEYGILSVYLQAVYNVTYHFTVPPSVFNPPPKVNSGVISLIPNPSKTLQCPEDRFKLIIRSTFNHRRKMLRNTLKPFIQSTEQQEKLSPYLDKRPEQLTPGEFQKIVNILI